MSLTDDERRRIEEEERFRAEIRTRAEIDARDKLRAEAQAKHRRRNQQGVLGCLALLVLVVVVGYLLPSGGEKGRTSQSSTDEASPTPQLTPGAPPAQVPTPPPVETNVAIDPAQFDRRPWMKPETLQEICRQATTEVLAPDTSRLPDAPKARASRVLKGVVLVCTLRHSGLTLDDKRRVAPFLYDRMDADTDPETFMTKQAASHFQASKLDCATVAGTGPDRYEKAYRCMADYQGEVPEHDRAFYRIMAEREATAGPQK